MERLLISRREAAKVMGLSETTVIRLSRTKGFPVVRVGRRRLIDAKGLEEWIAAQRTAGAKLEGK